ncbi:unnamed protein product [Rotaria socialis]|uniref:Protein kinase domain-containing protein n=1 Tax=Rotaria socialis TaxID=392032 RepID=A0A818PCC9_9BILA|nr:unnamed protein product [Rotaria socialis]
MINVYPNITNTAQSPPVIVQPYPVTSSPTIIVQKEDPDVQHGCHFVLCLISGGLWIPCWIGACCGCCCRRPCAVYEAIDPGGHRVAVKVIDLYDDSTFATLSDDYQFEDYMNKIESLYHLTASKNEKHVIQVYELGVDSQEEYAGCVYIIMELGQESLDRLIEDLHQQYVKIQGVNRSNEYIPPHYRRLIWKQLVQIVSVLQRYNIAHMDLKPQNIVRVDNILKVCNFGLSKYEFDNEYDETPNFSAPEVLILQGPQYQPQADIWSIGAMLYYMTYGKQPNWNPENRAWEPPYGHAPVQDPLVRDLLRKTLQYYPEDRPALEVLKHHPYTARP